MTIKSGTLCYVVGVDIQSWNGRVVTALRFLPAVRVRSAIDGAEGVAPVWEITAPWLFGKVWAVYSHQLRPIHDPDADIRISDETEGLHDELVRVLADARPV